MNRTVQRAFADQLASQLRALPTIPSLPSSQTIQSHQHTSPLDYVVQYVTGKIVVMIRPAILMEASNAMVFDIQTSYSSSLKEKQVELFKSKLISRKWLIIIPNGDQSFLTLQSPLLLQQFVKQRPLPAFPSLGRYSMHFPFRRQLPPI